MISWYTGRASTRGQDSHPGWHFILGLLHGYLGLDGDSLVVFSFVFLWILICLPSIFLLRRPEIFVFLLLLFFLFEPWAEKMSRSDRMIIKNTNRIDPSPAIPQLEWRFVYPSYWVGKLRKDKNP